MLYTINTHTYYGIFTDTRVTDEIHPIDPAPPSSFDPMAGHNLALEHLSSMDTVPAMLTDGQEQLPYHTVPGAASVAVPVNAQRSAIRPAAFPNTLERKRRPVGVRRVR